MSALVFALPLLALPHLASFDVDVSGLLGYAEDMFNGLMPAFIPVIGIVFGISLVLLVIGVIAKAVKGARA